MIEWSESQLYEKVKSIVAEALEVDPKSIDPQTLIIADLGAESIDLLDITFRLEKVFQIQIPEKYLSTKSERIPEGKTAAEILNVDLLVDFVKEMLKETGIRILQ
jgi:acyl carrier protein